MKDDTLNFRISSHFWQKALSFLEARFGLGRYKGGINPM